MSISQSHCQRQDLFGLYLHVYMHVYKCAVQNVITLVSLLLMVRGTKLEPMSELPWVLKFGALENYGGSLS